MIQETRNGVTTFYASSRARWRAWLAKNHDKSSSVWLIIYNKGSNTPSVNYVDAVEEALCFGWIDSKPNKRDHESRFQLFAKRKPKSVWSKINRERVERLITEKKMTTPGLEAIERAKDTGKWNELDDIDNMIIPEDLSKSFLKNKTARKNFDSFPPSSKKIILSWIQQAKRPETRKKRISEAIDLAAKNIRANHYRQ